MFSLPFFRARSKETTISNRNRGGSGNTRDSHNDTIDTNNGRTSPATSPSRSRGRTRSRETSRSRKPHSSSSSSSRTHTPTHALSESRDNLKKPDSTGIRTHSPSHTPLSHASSTSSLRSAASRAASPPPKPSSSAPKGKGKEPVRGRQEDEGSKKGPSEREMEIWYTRGHLVNVASILSQALRGKQPEEPRSILRGAQDLEEFKDPKRLETKLDDLDKHLDQEINRIRSRLLYSVTKANEYLACHQDVEGLGELTQRFEYYEKQLEGCAKGTAKEKWDTLSGVIDYLIKSDSPESQQQHHRRRHRGRGNREGEHHGHHHD